MSSNIFFLSILSIFLLSKRIRLSYECQFLSSYENSFFLAIIFYLRNSVLNTFLRQEGEHERRIHTSPCYSCHSDWNARQAVQYHSHQKPGIEI